HGRSCAEGLYHRGCDCCDDGEEERHQEEGRQEGRKEEEVDHSLDLARPRGIGWRLTSANPRLFSPAIMKVRAARNRMKDAERERILRNLRAAPDVTELEAR